MEEKSKVNEEAILFPEEEIAGFKVRPWTLGSVVALAPTIQALVAMCRQHGITAENYEEKINEKFIEVILDTVPHLPKLISVTVKISIEQAEEITLPNTVKLLVGIIRQNGAYLKNAFARVGDISQTLKAASSGT